MAATISVLSQKGGTGKTTAVRTLTDVFRRVDLRVLAIDLDPQGNLSDYLDVDPEASPTIGDVLAGRAKAREAVHDGIIPANLGLAEAELALGGKMGRELALKKALRELRDDYDVIMIDCPPALGLLTVNALVASDYALISAEAQYFSLQGVEQALEVIELARENLNPDLEWLGVVLNIADMRTRHSREAFDSLRQHFADKLLETTIRQSIAYAESAERAVSILDYRPDLAADYLAVSEELLKRLGMDGPRRRARTLAERDRRRFLRVCSLDVPGSVPPGVLARRPGRDAPSGTVLRRRPHGCRRSRPKSNRPLIRAERPRRERHRQPSSATRNPARAAISPQSALDETAERPATTAQFTGLKSATWAIHHGMMFAARNVVDRNVSGSRMNCVAPISASSWPMISAKPFDRAPNIAPSSAETTNSNATPPTPPGKLAPTISASATMISDWITTTTASFRIRPAISASRRTGETRKRAVTPRRMSSISDMPLHAALNIAVITTTPGARNAM